MVLPTSAFIRPGDTQAIQPHADTHLPGGADPIEGQIPRGVIVMWSGSLATIPSGWALCDGTNGTPDLRDRFIFAAGGGSAPGDTGGTAMFLHSSDGSHQHNSTGGQTLSHTNNHSFVSDHNHGPGNVVLAGVDGGTFAWSAFSSSTNSGGHSHTGHDDHSVSAHQHSFDGGHRHDVHPFPPYVALAFIMKL